MSLIKLLPGKNVIQKGGLSDIVKDMSTAERKDYLSYWKKEAKRRKEVRQSDTPYNDEVNYTRFRQQADVFDAEQRRLQQVDNLFDNPNRVPDQTTMNVVLNSPLLMGLEEGVESAATRANLKPPKPGDEFLPSGHGDALASLETPYTAPNTPASLLQGSGSFYEGPFSRDPLVTDPQFFGRDTSTLPPVAAPTPPTPPTPSNATIASMLSEFTPEDLAKIHRGNVAASHPGASEEVIDQLTAEGVAGGPATRLGALADDGRAFNEMLQGRSYRELFGDPANIAKMSDQEKSALIARQEEMLMNELTAPNAPYVLSPVDNNFARAQNNEAHQRLMRGEGYSEAAHTNANLATTNEAMTVGSTSGGTGAFTTTPTQSNSFLGGMDPSTGAGIAKGIGMGALLGGTANYAMGGEFSEGAMMGGLAGGGIMIGARAIGANQNQISNYMQRQVLGDAFVEGADNAASVRALSDETVGRLGFGQRQAYNQLMRGADTPRMQARHAVMGGSMLAGVAFTGRRNDKRRGFNAHRGNRI